MTLLEQTLLVLVFVWCVALLAVALRTRRRARLDEYRYRLFSIRDRVFLLVVDGTLEEGSATYEVLCTLTNGVVRNVKQFKPRSLAQAYIAQDERTFKHRELFERFESEMEFTSSEVLAILDDFFEALLQLLVENSLSLRVFLFVRRWVHGPLRWARRISRPASLQAYQLGASRRATLHRTLEDAAVVPTTS